MGKRLKVSSGRGHSAPSRIPWDTLNTRHDEAGQVYTEVSCPGSSMTGDWKLKTKGRAPEHTSFRCRGPGCSSLYDMSMRNCLSNTFDITAKLLAEIPETIGLALWDRIVAVQLDSVQVFIEFAQRYSSAIRRKYHVIPKPNLPLLSYYDGITSPSDQWLTWLTLSNVTTPRTTLIQLSLVTNLVVLTIGPNVLAPDIGVDDSLIRTWSRSASTGAFRSLRVLVLRGQPNVTPRAFEYLSSFPALSIFATNSVRGSGLMNKDMPSLFGWKHKSTEKTDEWLSQHCDWDKFLQNLFQLGGAGDPESLPKEGTQEPNILPVIHLAVGGYSEHASVAKSEEGTMHVWIRTTMIGSQDSEMKNKSEASDADGNHTSKLEPFSCALRPDIVRKRAHDSTTQVANRAVKPTLRTSKAHNISDLLSKFVAWPP